MPWHIPNDLKYVKELTSGNTIVMGRKTYESLGKALPNRRNVVLTRNKTLKLPDADVIHSIDDINKLDGKVFIFGGSRIYEETMHLVDEMFITVIEERFAGDAFFPDYNPDEWDIISETKGTMDDKNIFPHTFLHLRRKQ